MHGDKASGDHDSDPVGQRHDLLKVGGDDEHGGAAIAFAPQDRVDLGFGAHVDADCRFIQNEDARGAREPFAEQNLLLVAAREQVDRPLPVGRLNGKVRNDVPAGFDHAAAI